MAGRDYRRGTRRMARGKGDGFQSGDIDEYYPWYYRRYSGECYFQCAGHRPRRMGRVFDCRVCRGLFADLGQQAFRQEEALEKLNNNFLFSPRKRGCFI